MSDEYVSEEDIKRAALCLRFLDCLPEIAEKLRQLNDSLQLLLTERTQTKTDE